jgi:hypothetical protein
LAPLEVHACAVFASDEPEGLHALARAFRAGDPVAFDEVLGLVAGALEAGVPGLVAGVPGVPAVAVPGHRAGSGNDACSRLIVRLAALIPWLEPAPGLLERTADAPEGKTAPGRDPAAEAATLRWRPERLPAGALTDGALPGRALPDAIGRPGAAGSIGQTGHTGPILLLDDVVRTGSTLAAAIHAAPPDLARRIVPVAVFQALPPAGEGRTAPHERRTPD